MAVLFESFGQLQLLVLLGMGSALLSTLAFVPYMRDTMRRKTQPQRASWLIWSVLGSIAFFSQVYEGATSSLWFVGVQVSCSIIILGLSVWFGQGRFLARSDYYILALAALGLVLWYYTETAAYALAITISISLLGGVATAAKAYRDPGSETLSTWVFSLIASVLAIFSVGKLDWVLLAYPLYLFTLYSVFVAAIVLGRRRPAVAAVVANGAAAV
jgi:hypothetical protein